MLPTRNPYIGTLGLPKEWQRWFDALRSQGVSELADQSVGVKRGMFEPQPQPGQFTEVTQTNLPQARSIDPRWIQSLRKLRT